jgi:hypothetical protein
MTTQSGAGANSSSNAGSKASPASMIGAWIEKEFGLVYESRSGLIALLHRLGLEYGTCQ